MNTRRPQRRSRLFTVLLALLALTWTTAWSSDADARGKLLKRAVAKKLSTIKRLAPSQQKARKQKMKARIIKVWRTPRQRRVRKLKNRRKSGIVVVKRGPMRQRARRRTQFNVRSKRKSRSIDEYGAWTRHDPYSIR